MYLYSFNTYMSISQQVWGGRTKWLLGTKLFSEVYSSESLGVNRHPASTAAGFLSHLVWCFLKKWAAQKLASQTRTSVKNILLDFSDYPHKGHYAFVIAASPSARSQIRNKAKEPEESQVGCQGTGKSRKRASKLPGAEASACMKPVKMFSAESFPSDTSTVLGEEKFLTSFSSLQSLILLSILPKWIPSICPL